MGMGGDQLDEMLDQALSAFEEGQSLPEDALDDEETSDLAADEPPGDCITAPESVRALQDEWHGVFPLEKPFSVHDTPFGATDPWEPATKAWWGAWLEAHPQAYDSLDILDDIATALHLHPQFGAGWLDDGLLGPVLSRAAAIVDQAIADRPQPRLEWGWMGNRPALRSLVRLGWLHQRAGRHEQDLALTERLVALNPHDNHGLRAELMRGYLETGRDEAALALAAKFPNDLLVDITYGRALALFRLGRRDEATAALREALEHPPKVGKFLLAERRRRPRIDPHGVSIGGDDEAWMYREAMRGTWQATAGAMAWLGEVARGRA
jgi:tetratricopeptide (TPR) repeat protein